MRALVLAILWMPAMGLLLSPERITRAPQSSSKPVVARMMCEAQDKQAQAAELRLEIEALQNKIKAKRKEASTALTPNMVLMAEINEMEEQVEAKEQSVVDLVGKQVRYSAVGRLREKQAKERAERKQSGANTPQTVDATRATSRVIAGLVVLGALGAAYTAFPPDL